MHSGRDGVGSGAVGVWGERFGKDADRDWVIVAGGDGRGTDRDWVIVAGGTG